MRHIRAVNQKAQRIEALYQRDVVALQQAGTPQQPAGPHIPLGWVNKCDRCHFPTNWHHARQD